LSFAPKMLRSHPPSDALMAMATNVLTKLPNSLQLQGGLSAYECTE
jgi:hypothetical protein